MSRIVLSGESVFAYELAEGTPMSASLVVLAACQSGFVDSESDDDGAMSIARSFLARGVGAVLAASEDVDDKASLSLMVEFHRAYARHRDAPEALRAAVMASLRDQSEPQVRSWAPYRLYLGASFSNANSSTKRSLTSEGG
jgi:CHAT domain-containing protein